jgi:hypothetical protein
VCEGIFFGLAVVWMSDAGGIFDYRNALECLKMLKNTIKLCKILQNTSECLKML